MPVIKVYTNLATVPVGFESRLAQVLSESIQRPVDWIYVVVQTGLLLSKGTDTSPLAIFEITSNTGLSRDSNQTHTSAICQFMSDELEFQPNRVLLNFRLIPSEMIGYNGRRKGKSHIELDHKKSMTCTRRSLKPGQSHNCKDRMGPIGCRQVLRRLLHLNGQTKPLIEARCLQKNMRIVGWSHFLIILISDHIVDSLKCFSCASYEYRVLFDKDTSLSRKVRVPKFDRLCDLEDMVQGFAPVESCHSTCVTIFEPQYFGGLQSLQRPYLYIRGCADHIFSAMKERPIEVEFLHRSPICVKLQLSQIYPQVQANEIVQVCSCDKDGCNFSSSNSAGASSFVSFLVMLIVLSLSLPLVIF